MQPSNSRNGIIFTALSATIWGTSFIFVKITVDELGIFFSLFIRMFLAFLSSAILFIIMNRQVIHANLFYFKRSYVYLITLLNVGGYFFQNLGATITGSAKIALLVNSTSFMVPIISYFILKEIFNYKKGIGLVVGFSGLFFLTTGGDFQTLLQGSIIGDLFCLLGGLCWALYIVFSRKLLIQKDEGYQPLNLSFVTIMLSFLFLFPLIPMYLTSFAQITSITADLWLELTYLGIFTTTIAYTLYYIGLKSISATKSAFILLLEVVFATLIGILLIGEIFNIFHIFGAILIIAAIIIINLY
ncbi:MAG: DMT family transporter [Candidatus Helarchaeota archaeon]|nr:DMT family transporter [Candidatus Helarchaeota archaeon]